MSFSLNLEDRLSLILIQKIREAESKGLTSINISGKNIKISRKIQETQVLHWKDDSEEYVWEVSAVNELKTTSHWEINGIINIDIQKIDLTYLPEKQIFLKEEDVAEEENILRIEHEIEKNKLYLDKHGRFIKFKGCSIIESVDHEITSRNSLRNPHGHKVMADRLVLGFYHETSFYSEDDDNIEYSEVTYSLKDILDLDLLHVKDSEKGFRESARNVALNGVDSIRDKILLGDDENDNGKRELVGVASKEHMEALMEVATEKRTTAMLFSRGVSRYVGIERKKIESQIAEQMKEIEKVRSFINGQVSVLKKKIDQMTKLIVTLELYAGISESLFQIIEGEQSTQETIHIRQKVLFLDEEMALFEQQGLEWEKIEDFDNWLRENPDKISELLPEEKCIVVCRVRRENKEYSWIENPFARSMAEENTNKALLLFRNGDNIYRIWSEHLDKVPRFFPKKSELQENYEQISSYYQELEEMEENGNHSAIEDKIESAEDKMFPYKKNVLMLHGVLSRTEIMGQLPQGFNLMRPDTHGEIVKYVYDDEMMLNSTHESFSQWLRRINSNIVKGSRIHLSKEVLERHGNRGSMNWKERFNYYWDSDHLAPPMPSSGIYSVLKNIEEVAIKNEETYFKEDIENIDFLDENIVDVEINQPYYNVHNGEEKKPATYIIQRKFEDGDERKYEKKEILRISYDRRTGRQYGSKKPIWTSFMIEPSDNFIIHVDGVELEEVRRHINDKHHRYNYLQSMPVLRQIEKMLMDEQAKELEYANAMAERINFELGINDLDLVVNDVLDSIKWYKLTLATVNKRSLPTEGKDFAKAWQLVELNTKRSLKKKKKLKIDVSGIVKGEYSMNDVIDICHRSSIYERRKFELKVYGTSKKDAVDKILDILMDAKQEFIFRLKTGERTDITRSFVVKHLVFKGESEEFLSRIEIED